MAKSFRSLQVVSNDCKVHDLAVELHEKVTVTLQPIAPLDIPTQWGDELLT